MCFLNWNSQKKTTLGLTVCPVMLNNVGSSFLKGKHNPISEGKHIKIQLCRLHNRAPWECDVWNGDHNLPGLVYSGLFVSLSFLLSISFPLKTKRAMIRGVCVQWPRWEVWEALCCLKTDSVIVGKEQKTDLLLNPKRGLYKVYQSAGCSIRPQIRCFWSPRQTHTHTSSIILIISIDGLSLPGSLTWYTWFHICLGL